MSLNTEDRRAEKRAEMVETQLRARGIVDPNILNSLSRVPRHLFVPPSLEMHAYEDKPLPIECNQTISQPYIVALMIQEAKLKSTDTVLDVGTGSGYSAAVLSSLVKKVYTVEIIPELGHKAAEVLKELGYENVEVKISDGSIGFKEHAPYDAILVAASAPSVPTELKEQLKVGGRLILPVGTQNFQKLLKITRLDKDRYREKTITMVKFVPLTGRRGW